MIRLGVNIDHVATLRQARKTNEPDPVQAALIAEEAGADGITMHLRSDRRHIQDRDVYLVREVVRTRLNLEMSLDPKIVDIALKVNPQCVCIVPENRTEVTTEGGLDVIKDRKRVEEAVARLRGIGAAVSLFIDADSAQIEAAAASGAQFIELHTGVYANAYPNEREQNKALSDLEKAVNFAKTKGLRVNAGHGLTYHNVMPIAALPEIEELNIGHSIMARALMIGLPQAIKDMKALMILGRGGHQNR
jgi:pyridoxine 5-phosphate synthase